MRIAGALLLAALLACVAAPPAAAAPYTVWSCRDAAGAPLSTAAWIPGGNAGTREDTCAAGGALTVALGAGDTAPGARSGYRFAVPAGVAVTGYTAWLAAATAATAGSPAAYGAGLGQSDPLSTPTLLDGCYTEDRTCTWGTFADPLAPENRVELPVLLGGLGLLAACASPDEPCAPAADPPARVALFRIAVELDDPSAPAVGAPGGTLAAGGAVTGVRSVVADVGDVGSGVRTTELLVDGAVADRQDGTGPCAPPYTVADPCPRGGRATFVLDTAALPEGAHTVAVRAVDAAGNATTSAPRGITVDHPDPPAASGVVALRLAAPRRVGLPAGDAVTGTVVDAAGAPRPGVALRFERRAFGAGEDGWRPVRATAVTDAAGRFRVPVPSASAQVRALVASSGFAAPPAVTAFVGRLRASIDASRKRLRNGDRLTLRGRLRNAGEAGVGRTVLIQSRVRGRWRAVDSVETRRGGRITWRYRFTNTQRTARYRFRFVIPRTAGLPWQRLATRQVSVLVRGG